MILRKIIKNAATRYHILKLKCTKFDFGCGSAPDPAPKEGWEGRARRRGRRSERKERRERKGGEKKALGEERKGEGEGLRHGWWRMDAPVQ